MGAEDLIRRHRAAVVVAAALAPLAGCAVLAPFRDQLANTNEALVLVLLVVAAAATGLRSAGVVAALSSTVWFDFFLTRPYQSFTINSSDDVETAVLLVVVGLAVTEVALWGRRQQARASRRQGYLNGVAGTAELVAAGNSSTAELLDRIGEQLVEVLGIDAARYVPSDPAGLPVLGRDGTLTRAGRTVDVDRTGLPTDDETALPVRHAGVDRGHFRLVAATRITRPNPEQRRVAIMLADQAGAALATTPLPH